MKVDHIGIYVEDISKIANFYTKYFKGILSQPAYHNPKKNFTSHFISFESGAKLEIMHQPNIPIVKREPKDQFIGFIHISFSVGSKENVDKLTAQLKEDGYEIIDGPRTTGDGFYEACVLDPENNRVEFTI